MKGGIMEYRSVKLFGLLVALVMVMACSVLGSGSGEDNVPMEGPGSGEEGSGPNESGEGPSATGSGLCANAYYPVVYGGTWNYQGTSSAAEDFSFTNTITSVRNDGFTVTVEFDEVTLVQEWACTPEGILALDSGGGTAGTLTTSDINLVMETQNASGITYPNDISPGKTWAHTLDYTGTMDVSGEPVEFKGNTEYNYTAIGVESISAPSGTFDAMKVEITTTINMNMTMQGSEVPVTFTSNSTSWYAQDVGWVKTISMSDMFGTTSSETVELQWYNIP